MLRRKLILTSHPITHRYVPTETINLPHSIAVHPSNGSMESNQIFDYWLIVTPCDLPHLKIPFFFKITDLNADPYV